MKTTRNSKVYYKKNWLGVVLDEGHKIKNPKAQTNINVNNIDSEWRLVLTGVLI